MGILSKGLRVAPPEAPNNGYMFGKGVRLPTTHTRHIRSDSDPDTEFEPCMLMVLQIYFADSVSKSANYCWPTPENPRVRCRIS